MPSKTEKQARFMRAVAHGWKPRHAKAPPVEVAQEFVAADQAAGMYEGGLAPMNDLTQRGFAPGLTGMAPGFQEGGDVMGGLTFKQLYKELGSDIGAAFEIMRGIEDGTYFKNEETGLLYKPQPTILAAQAPEEALPVATAQGPRSGGRRGRRGGGRRGRNGGGGGGGGGGGPTPDPTCPSGFRRRGGQCVPEDTGRIIPPDVPLVDSTPPDRRAGRDTEYSDAIRAHKLRIAATLAVPPGGYAGGGPVRYQEGGAVRPGHYEDTTKGPNPYEAGTASYNYWERRFHAEPPPPPPPEEEEEEIGWLASLLGKKKASETRTERELEEMEQAYGGYVDGYQAGGLAQANFRRPPMGGVPPSMGGGMGPRRGGVPPRMKPQFDPRAMPPQPYGGGATTGQGSLPAHLQNIQAQQGQFQQRMPVGMKDPRGRIAPPPSPPRGRMPFGGRDPRAMPPGGRGGRINPRGIPVPRGMPPGGGGPGGGPGQRGGPMIPPNLRGYLQQSRMMNRPRRGVPGPAGAGGQPNRVGMQDQQGGLARALQRGTGRPPMSRRSGFPGR